MREPIWIYIGKLESIESIFIYANTIDMVWHLGIVKK